MTTAQDVDDKFLVAQAQRLAQNICRQRPLAKPPVVLSIALRLLRSAVSGADIERAMLAASVVSAAAVDYQLATFRQEQATEARHPRPQRNWFEPEPTTGPILSKEEAHLWLERMRSGLKGSPGTA